jgi:sulfite exporter TauE/SafE
VFLDHLGAMLSRRGQLALELLEGSLTVFQVGMPFTVLIPPLIFAYMAAGLERSGAWLASQLILTLSLVTAPVLLEVVIAQKLLYPDWRARVGRIFRGLPLLMGLTVALFLGVLDTVTRSKAEFVQTPKKGQLGVVRTSAHAWLRGFLPIAAGQWTLAAVCLAALALALARGYWESLPILLSMGSGFLLSALLLSRELRQKSQLAKLVAPAGA